MSLILLATLVLSHATCRATPDTGPTAAAAAATLDPRPTTANCSELFFEQPVDQYNYNSGQPTWMQRYFLCDQFFDASLQPPPPVLFLAGNEGAIPKAVNTSGLLWEMAAEWGALLVFAEHRYYGESQPVNDTSSDAGAAAFQYLTVDQALVDYVKLIQHIKEEYNVPAAPVAAFGASYGAMLAAWLRAKYPNVVTAALASSGPLRCTLVDGQGWDPSTFWEVVTHAASPEAGASPACAPAVRAAFAALFDLSATKEGRRAASSQLRLCSGVLAEEGDASLVALFLMMAFDTAAMSSYPYPSSYFTGDPDHPLPAWPMRAACQQVEGPLDTPEELLGALSQAVGVVYNVTGDVECYTRQDVYSLALQTDSPYSGGSYIYQVCNQFVPSESFFPPNGTTDMFWDAGPFNTTSVDSFCRDQFGKRGPLPDFRALPLLFGASPSDFAAASQIIFSNGLLDPWSSGGFLSNLSESLVAVVMPNAGHHVDLYWPEPSDPPNYAAVRQQEKRLLAQWLGQSTPASDGVGMP